MPQDATVDKASQKMHDAFEKQSLRKIWAKFKKESLKAVKQDDRYEDEFKKLNKTFIDGLGPKLDKWDAECAKFPKHDAKKMGKYGGEAAKIIDKYKKQIDDIDMPSKTRMGLTTVLDEIAKEMLKRQKFYAKVSAGR